MKNFFLALLLASLSCGCASVDAQTTLVVEPQHGNDSIVIVTTELPVAELNSKYDTQLLASGGSLPYHWSIIAGDLPKGLKLSNDGELSGTPSEQGSYMFIVEVRGSGNNPKSNKMKVEEK